VVSSISAMNVDTPRSWLSPAPTRHKIASATQMSAKVQGTKQPICAIKMATPIYALDQRVDALLPVVAAVSVPSECRYSCHPCWGR